MQKTNSSNQINPQAADLGHSKEYFYVFNANANYKELCALEMKSLFGELPDGNYVLSDRAFGPSKSPFIRHTLSVIYSADTLDEIVQRINENQLTYERYKVIYIKSGDQDVSYTSRIESVKRIGNTVLGSFDIETPAVLLGVSKVKDKWVFGVYQKNTDIWAKHNSKPYSYSNAISTKLARAIVNIAMGNDLSRSLIDPCCGIGTVVVEALDMGIAVKGYEINEFIARNARANLLSFGYDKETITIGDMHTITESFDVAIIDIPYGLFSATTPQEQVNILNKSREITSKLVLVSNKDMRSSLISAGYEIVENCYVPARKGFKRYIYVCE